MKDEIDKQDYDIALIGCGAYGFPLAAHIKRSGKKAIHLGGALQLLFGIKGKRWTNPTYGMKSLPFITENYYNNMLNDFWTSPAKTEKPLNANNVVGDCFWYIDLIIIFYLHSMPVNIKVVYITKYNKKFILNKPDNFAYYIKSIMNSNLIDVHLLNPLPLQKNNSIQTLIALVKTIKDINPDILYLDNLQGLNKLVVLKRVGILKCKIVAWKYTYCKEYSNSIKNWFTKFFYWKGIDRIYMMFDNHTRHALSHNIVKDYQITTLSRGAEIKWYEKYLKPQKDNFLVMATGKDSRDYQTLSEACEQTQTNCHIITRRHESNIKVAEKFKNSQYIKFTFMEDLHINNEYEYIMQQQGQASILAIPCERREYGVGYTNIVEALPYYIPILMTHNPDIHIDLEKENIGYLIEPYDVETWKEKIIYLKQHPEVIETMSKHAKKLTEGEYNAQTTASYIINDFIRIIQ